MPELVIYTIGHSTLFIGRFLELLNENEISLVADVRSTPYSRYNPQFNRESLDEVLKEHNIRYEFFGNELGARINDMSYYKDGRVQYNLLTQRNEFRDAIEKLKQMAKIERITLMCSEREPLDCHRTILVAQELVKSGVAVTHILSDGSNEAHDETLDRLVSKFNGPNGNLFMSSEELKEEAIVRQSDLIAYSLTDSNKFSKGMIR